MYPRDLRRALLNEIRSEQTRGQAHGMTPEQRLEASEEWLELAPEGLRRTGTDEPLGYWLARRKRTSNPATP